MNQNPLMYEYKYNKYKQKYLALKEQAIFEKGDSFKQKYLAPALLKKKSLSFDLLENSLQFNMKTIQLKNDIQLLNDDKLLMTSRKDDVLCLLNKKLTKEQSLEYFEFLEQWLDFKLFASEQIKLTCARKNITICSSESINNFKIKNNEIVKKWLNLTHKLLDKKHIIDNNFINTQILNIELLGYNLLETDKAIIGKAFDSYLLCNVFPAPFSIAGILIEKQKRGCNEIKSDDITALITVSEHCLSMATYWYRHPPQFLTPRELTELIVLSIFHDIFYYQDFVRHDEMTLELFKPYIQSDMIKEVIGTHIDFIPNENEEENSKIKPIDKLKQDWTKMDWYLTSTTLERKSKENEHLHILPLEFFYKHIGDFLTNV